MGNLALYRKYRSLTFDTVVGQEHIVNALKTQVELGRISHAYIFTGTRGTGKTSCAKILARAVNCKNPQNGNPCNECDACLSAISESAMDIMEIDAASNNGVDSIRQLRDECVYSPTALKMRVYIIDEVHMLSAGAWGAMLKMLEEPPAHALFILATTEIHKVPVTILSRCQRYDFRRIDQKTISEHLKTISYKEGIDIADDAVELIARLGDGSMRDAISLLDRARASGEVLTYECAINALGIPNNDTMLTVFKAIASADSAAALECFGKAYEDGRDIISFFDNLLSVVRDVYVHKSVGGGKNMTFSSSLTSKELESVVGIVGEDTLDYYVDTIGDTLSRLTRTAIRRMDGEVCLLKLCRGAHKSIQKVQMAQDTEDEPPFDIPTKKEIVKPEVEKPVVEPLPKAEIKPETVSVDASEVSQDKRAVETNGNAEEFKIAFISALGRTVNPAIRTYLEQSEVDKVGQNVMIIVDSNNLELMQRESVIAAFTVAAKSMGQASVKVTDKKLEAKPKPAKNTNGMDDLLAAKELFGI